MKSIDNKTIRDGGLRKLDSLNDNFNFAGSRFQNCSINHMQTAVGRPDNTWSLFCETSETLKFGSHMEVHVWLLTCELKLTVGKALRSSVLNSAGNNG